MAELLLLLEWQGQELQAGFQNGYEAWRCAEGLKGIAEDGFSCCIELSHAKQHHRAPDLLAVRIHDETPCTTPDLDFVPSNLNLRQRRNALGRLT